MCLPNSYMTSTLNEAIYIKDCLDLFQDNEWVYNVQNTHILKSGTFLKMPEEWSSYFHDSTESEFNNLASGVFNHSCPHTLREFITRTKSLTPVHKKLLLTNGNFNFNRGLSAKKIHEVSKLSELINMICETNITYIIDAGCGLGYLAEILFKSYGYKVFGIDSNSELIAKARKLHCNSYKDSLQFLTHYISGTSDNIKEIVNKFLEAFPDFDISEDKICITGLHTCGSFGIALLSVFENIKFATYLVTMPCCYHKTKAIFNKPKTTETINKFPYSERLKSALIGRKQDLFSTYFLRMAAQRPNADQTDYEVVARNLLFRNILQLVIDKNKLQINRKKQKPGFKERVTITNFLNNIDKSYTFSSSFTPITDDYINTIKDEILDYYENQYKTTLNLFKGLNVLQTLFQGVFENIVLLDIIAYLNAKLFNPVLYKIADENISPRCYVIFATK